MEYRKLGLFLGAGFSYELGLPLVLEVTAELKRVLSPQRMIALNKHWRTGNLGYSDRSIEILNTILKQQNYNYENIVGALEVNITRFENREIYQDLHGLREWLLEFIWNIFTDRQIRTFQYCKGGIQFYKGIVKLYETAKPLWVFSLNHDITFELIAKYFGLEVKTGFPETIEIERREASGELSGSVKFDYLSRSDIKNNNYNYYFNYENQGINLLKMHGAIDLFGKDDDLNYVKLSLEGLSFDEYYENARYLFKDLDQLKNVRMTNHIGYYDKAMTLQILRKTILSGVYKFDNRVSQVAPIEYIQLFKSYINYVDELIVVGYSFSDFHIDTIIREWLTFTSTRKLVIVNPSITAVPNYFTHLTPQIKLERMTATEFLMKIEGRRTKSLIFNVRVNTRKRLFHKLTGR